MDPTFTLYSHFCDLRGEHTVFSVTFLWAHMVLHVFGQKWGNILYLCAATYTHQLEKSTKSLSYLHYIQDPCIVLCHCCVPAMLPCQHK